MQPSDRERAEAAGLRLHRFHGGLKLRHNKRISCQQPLRRAPMPPRLVVPLQQHLGAPAMPIVETGSVVLKGQPIARYAEPELGQLHAPTSGRVTAIARQPVSRPGSEQGMAILIQPDGRDCWTELKPLANWQQQPVDMLLQHIADAGIAGLGGAVFPTERKLADATHREIHTLILNGAECEPYISCDEMLMREEPQRILEGARILQHASGARRTLIAIEDQMGAVRTALQAAIDQGEFGNMQVVQVTTIYPEGGERQLVEVLTGVQVPDGGRPTDLGLLCQNVATAAAVADAVLEGKPLIERIVTVTGPGIRQPANLIACFGTPFATLVDACGGYRENAARLILGGPMMGYALDGDNHPVVKAANCLLVLTRDDLRQVQGEMPCIRCGECARVCPASLLPQQLHWQVRNDLLDDAAEDGLAACIECGCCDTVCPSHIPLTEWFRFGKAELRLRQEERQRAELARQRHEARELRLQREQLERQQRMEAKKQALREKQQAEQRIAAAVARAEQRKGAAGGDNEPPEST